VTRRRLDTELVRRGLVASRADAQRAVLAGLVRVGGSPASKATTLVSDDMPVALAEPKKRFVSRGGEKLAAALSRFQLDPSGTDCLDAGASTGGFTDCLLQAGARHVVSVDVGYGQLAWNLRLDDRVTVLERTNVRDLTTVALPYRPTFMVVDLSFISLRSVLPALSLVASEDADAVLLVKPQFEARSDHVGLKGVVRDPAVWTRVLDSVIEAARRAGLEPRSLMASPSRGPAGNVEFLLWARMGAEPAMLAVGEAIAEGEAVSR
jgi:23S rRNA (cytidine1920-2'-O)/16S rRNA (cytidine1409-2'-O)-methyltransferase